MFDAMTMTIFLNAKIIGNIISTNLAGLIFDYKYFFVV